jgi:hypothetical protein
VIRLTFLIASLVMMLTACSPRGDIIATDLPSNTEKPPTHEVTKQQSPTSTSEATAADQATPTFTPEFVGPPIPPLTSHEWMPESILVKIEAVGTGDGCCIYSLPPFFILYADGTLIIRNDSDLIQKTVLDRRSVCSVLNTIDQYGFLDYDPNTYGVSPIGYPSRTRILVNAWKTKDIILEDLFGFIYGLFDLVEYGIEEPEPVILPALRDTFTFLINYQPEGLVPFEPNEQIVWIYEPWWTFEPDYEVNEEEIPEWPLVSIELVDLSKASKCGDSYMPIILEGEQLIEWREKIKNGPYKEDDLFAEIYSRPLFPGEISPGCGNAQPAIFPIDMPDPTLSMICNPEDGIIRPEP